MLNDDGKYTSLSSSKFREMALSSAKQNDGTAINVSAT
jgi:hypothetical protein